MKQDEYLNALKDRIKSVDIKGLEKLVADHKSTSSWFENGKSEEQL